LAIAPPPIDPRALSTQLASFSRELGCADLTSAGAEGASPTVIGFVTSTNARGRLARMLEGSPNLEHAQNTVNVRPWAQCDNTIGLVRSAGALDAPATAPRLDFNVPNRNYRLGDKLIMHVTNNATSDGYLYIDFIDSTGSVAHLLPRPGGPRNTVRAGQTMTLGDSADTVLEISEPLGPNLILAIFSPQSLFAARGDEAADRYLPVLSRALTAATHRPEAERPGATYAFVNALPR
jgi:hypothetical protein